MLGRLIGGPIKQWSRRHPVLFMILLVVGGQFVVINITTSLYYHPPIYSPYGMSYELDITPDVPPQSPINLSAAGPGVEGDLAWNKPTFASSYFDTGYPSRATNGTDSQPGPDLWRSAGSTGTWFYVDLGRTMTFRTIITDLYIDPTKTDYSNTAFLASNNIDKNPKNIADWSVIHIDIKSGAQMTQGAPQQFFFHRGISARYVGFYAQDWGGAWAKMSQFTLLP